MSCSYYYTCFDDLIIEGAGDVEHGWFFDYLEHTMFFPILY